MNNISSDELASWLALWRVNGVGAKTYVSLLEKFATPEKVLSASASALREAGLNATLVNAIQTFDKTEIKLDLAWLSGDDCHLMRWTDSDYPTLLKEISDPPPILFIRGDHSLLNELQLAMVGTRNPTPMARKTATAFATTFAQFGLIVTSGLALGVDQAAHIGALEGGGKTIAVAATGLDRVYPAKNRALAQKIVDSGAIVSEFPIGTSPKPGYFPRRNRIISGLSLGTLVVEAAIKSGSLVTAHHAMEQGREVFAIPGSIHNPLAKGCHHLIRQGAKLVETANDVLEDLGNLPLVSVTDGMHQTQLDIDASDGLTPEYTLLLEKIAFDPTSVDSLVEESQFTAEEISSMLLVLELQGLVSSAPGGLFYRCSDI
ncbi:MAG: DNA processing protein DprA [Cycloclasticus sp. symbiont of Poecilosclerida sp. M]|nr:MAG: DNA processing protein DprA [Cycloclasticus sp. symbiont of Poecilosclerida sp. M]